MKATASYIQQPQEIFSFLTVRARDRGDLSYFRYGTQPVYLNIC